MHRGNQERVHLVNELLDVEGDLHRFLNTTGLRTGAGRLGDARCPLER